MTLSPQAALSILIPINIEPRQPPANVPSSPADSLSSIDIQSDDENDREVAEKRLSRYYPTTPISVGPIVRPQLSCPDLGMGTARSMKARLKEPAPPVPVLPTFFLEPPSPTHQGERASAPGETSTPSRRSRGRQQNTFLPLGSVNRRAWEDTFGEEPSSPRKRHGMFFGRLHRYLTLSSRAMTFLLSIYMLIFLTDSTSKLPTSTNGLVSSPPLTGSSSRTYHPPNAIPSRKK